MEKDIIEQYKQDPLSIYTKNFFRVRRRYTVWEKEFGRHIVEYFKINSVVDFGCALASYISGAKEKGATILGFEYGYENLKEYLSEDVKNYVKYGNVMAKIECGKFDLSMSIEVAEHILPDKSDMFVENLVNSSNKYILVTTATPGQGGLAHINEQPKEFWIEKFEKYGFMYNKEITMDLIKSRTSKLPKHIRKNMMIFIKE